MYSFPSSQTFAFSLAPAQPPNSTKSFQFTTSALINHFSKSVWITPAACGAFAPTGIVQALTSCSPAVK